MSFFPLIPDCDEKGLKTVFVELLTYALSVSLTIEIHKNNIDTSRVTNKFLSNESDILRELLPNTTGFFQGNCIRHYFFQVWTYSKSLLTGIRANSTLRTVFNFKKLKIIYCWCIYYFLLWLQLSAFIKQVLPTWNENFIENK